MCRALIMLLLLLPMLAEGAAPPVRVGATVLQEGNYSSIAGKRVGLITNHTAVVEGEHLMDRLHRAGNVLLTALFAPEHGLRGVEEDGVPIAGGVDARTGVPIKSLYGREKAPTQAMLSELDLLLFDIQDVGARFYTFISTMGLAMQAAARAHIPFVVLDRPNPLGGRYVAGPVVTPPYISFVGQYPIPVAHGLTVGELALMIKGEKMLPGLEELDLRVIRMTGWRRDMQWPATGLPWIATSPNIPDFSTALLYPGICFFEATNASEGRGTIHPFQVVGYPGVDAAALAGKLNGKHLPGVTFEPYTFTPHPIPGMSSTPKFRDRGIPGVRLTITDPSLYRPVESGIYLLAAVYQALPNGEQVKFFRRTGFDQLAGGDGLRRQLEQGKSPEEICAGWEKEVGEFGARRQKYLLY